jgi:2-haloacid dehalogenase/putative hydrolase of the HAD superfamily
LHHFKIPLDAFELSLHLTDYRAHPTLFPESRDVLARCEIPVYLVTNIDNTEIQSAVQYCGLNFTGTITSEDCRAYKPRREVFTRALEVCGLQSDEVLHVGDSWHTDIQGAKSMGISVLWIDRRKRPLPDSSIKPDYTAGDLNGLLDVLKS